METRVTTRIGSVNLVVSAQLHVLQRRRCNSSPCTAPPLLGLIWRIGDGTNVKIWEDPWIPRGETRRPATHRGYWICLRKEGTKGYSDFCCSR